MWIHVNKASEDEKTRVKKLIRLNLLSDVDILTTVKQSNLFSAEVLLDTLASNKQNAVDYPGHRIPVPVENVATVKAGAKVIGGTALPHNSNANGILADYSNNMCYGNNTNVQLSLGDENGILVKLGRLFAIEKMSFDFPSFGYNVETLCWYVEISADGSSWTCVANSQDQKNARGCLTITFQRRAVMFIRIVGTNTNKNGKSFSIRRIFDVC